MVGGSNVGSILCQLLLNVVWLYGNEYINVMILHFSLEGINIHQIKDNIHHFLRTARIYYFSTLNL